MHEHPYNPTDYGCSEGTPLFPCRPTVKHRSHGSLFARCSSLKRCNTIMTLRLSGLLLKDPRSRGKGSRSSAILTC
jgi:hypothetical protein